MLVAVAVVLMGCDATAVPVGAEKMDEEIVETARAAWLAQGLPEPMCAAPLLLVVSPEEFDANKDNPLPSCASGKAAVCAYAGTDLTNHIVPITYYVPVSDYKSYNNDKDLPMLEILTHEIFHVWAGCTLGLAHGDAHHRDVRVWQGAIGFIDDIAGVAHHTYVEF